MSQLPRVTGCEVVRASSVLGYKKNHKKRSHIVLRQETYPYRRLVIPDHKEVAKGTLRAIIKQAGITVEEFKKLF